MSMMMSICRKTKSGLSNPLPVMGLRDAALEPHWLGFTGCPPAFMQNRRRHTNSAAPCKPSSRTHAAGCSCCRWALHSRPRPCSTLSRRFTTDLKDLDPLDFMTLDRTKRAYCDEVRQRVGYSDESMGGSVSEETSPGFCVASLSQL